MTLTNFSMSCSLVSVTLIRVVVLIALAAVVWVPIGVWVGLRPNLAHRVQPIVQFLAAFPANLFFPVAVFLIVRFHLNVEIWVSPLMILGTQWYILFNVIGGTLALPTDYQYVAGNLGVTRWLWWRRLILPAIFPAFVTGAVTASGGSWNASIVSEIVKWGNTTLVATGIGAYIAQQTEAGDFPRIALGIAVLCLYVLWPSIACCGGGSTTSPKSDCGWTDMDQAMTTANGCLDRRRERLQDLSAPDHAGRLVLDRIDFQPEGRRDRRHSRQVGLGQVDLPARAGGADAGQRRPRGLSRPRGHARRRPASPWCSRPSRCSRG